MKYFADTLVPPSCIKYEYAVRIGCLLHVLHLSVNACMENARLPACLAFIAPALGLNFALTLAHILDNDKRPSVIYDLYSRPRRIDGTAISAGTGECLPLERPDHPVDPLPVASAVDRVSNFVRWRLACNRREHGGLSSNKQQQ